MKSNENKQKNQNGSIWRCYSANGNTFSWHNDPNKGLGRKMKKTWEDNLWPKGSSGKSLPKTDELRGPGTITKIGRCENYKDTETMTIRPRKKDERRKSSEESDRMETTL